MNVYILGAGASKSFELSKTKEKLPLATDFFTTFNKLDISSNGWVLIGDIINYVQEYRNISVLDFSKFNEDIEVLHSEIQDKYLRAIENEDSSGIYRYGKAYNQLVLLFCSVINEVQNGEESDFHKNLVKNLGDDDVIITFNWDTLIDKSLKNNKHWSLQDGYYLTPKKVYSNGWVSEKPSGTKNFLLKLHGSTNWISSYIRYDSKKKKIIFEHGGESNLLYMYESTITPYPCYDGRFMEGYEPFSMGYYPPNIPSYEAKNETPEGHLMVQTIFRNGINNKGKSSKDGIPSMPIIIPPVLSKSYSFYGDIFPTLWKKAEDVLFQADKIYILGYSFPVTDTSSSELFNRAFCRRKTIPEVVIINPKPDDIVHKFKIEFGIPDKNLKILPDFITRKYIVK